MSRRVFLGAKVRRLRRESGITQILMAQQLGISPSYLNLIESNRRTLTPALAAKLTDLYDLGLETLSGRRELLLMEQLREVLGDDLFSSLRMSQSALETLVGEHPKICRAMLQLYGAYRKNREELVALTEQLAQDPSLADASHRLLTILTSVRTFAEILRDNVDLPEVKRAEFAGILVEESDNLTGQVRQLFEFIGEGGLGPMPAAELPRDEVNEAVQQRNNYFGPLESRAEEFCQAVAMQSGPGTDLDTLRREAETQGITVTLVSGDPTDGDFGHIDVQGDRLKLSIALSPAEQRFRLLRHLCERLHADNLSALVDEANLSSEVAKALYRRALCNYFAGAVLMPYSAFRRDADNLRHDFMALRHRYGVSLEQVCHRLTTLQRPGEEGIPFHLLRADIAGNLDKRFSASGLGLPRYGGLCPLWNLHRAFLQRGHVDRQIVEMPDGVQYIFLAVAVVKARASDREPERRHSIAMGCDMSFAPRIVYSDGLDLTGGPALPVGVSCRQCPRESCGHRAFPAVGLGDG